LAAAESAGDNLSAAAANGGVNIFF